MMLFAHGVSAPATVVPTLLFLLFELSLLSFQSLLLSELLQYTLKHLRVLRSFSDAVISL